MEKIKKVFKQNFVLIAIFVTLFFQFCFIIYISKEKKQPVDTSVSKNTVKDSICASDNLKDSLFRLSSQKIKSIKYINKTPSRLDEIEKGLKKTEFIKTPKKHKSTKKKTKKAKPSNRFFLISFVDAKIDGRVGACTLECPYLNEKQITQHLKEQAKNEQGLDVDFIITNIYEFKSEKDYLDFNKK